MVNSNYSCPSCGGMVRLDHVDDIGTKWFRCEECKEQTSRPKNMPEGLQRIVSEEEKRVLSEVTYCEQKSGERGVSIGEEEYFLAVKHARKLWKFRLINIFGGWEPVTAWISLLDPERLRTDRAAKPLRDLLEDRYIDKSVLALEVVIGLIQDNEKEWKSKKQPQPSLKKDIDFDEPTVEKAWNLLKDSAFFYKLGKVFAYGFVIPKINKPRFIIGEERNKRLLGPLLIGASKLNMTSIIKLLGDVGTAKDTMLRMWLKLLPIKSIERSYMTAASLRYSDAMKEADLLYIPDSPELRGEMGRHMRFMRADDGGLISEYATRDSETGEMTTKITRLPVKGVATTSNAITGDTALESGMWTVQTNGTEALTRLVKKEKLKLRAGNRTLFPEDELKVWTCAFNLLLTEEVPESLPTVPYAESLISILESERSESRRDPDKLCDLISLVAWIRRFQKDMNTCDEADMVDLYVALQIGLDAMTQTISELDEKEQRIFIAIKKVEETEVTCKDVASVTRIPYKTCYRYLEKLIEKGFILKDKEKGRNIYSSFPEKEPKQLLMLKGRNFGKPELLMKFILDSFKGFSLSHQGTHITSLIDPVTGEKVSSTIGEDGSPVITVENKIYLYPYEKVRSLERSKETILETEKESKQLLPSEMRRYSKVKSEAKANLDTVYSPIIFSVKNWCQAYRNEHNEISLLDLARFIRDELKQEPQRVIAKVFEQSILVEHPKKLGLAVVM